MEKVLGNFDFGSTVRFAVKGRLSFVKQKIALYITRNYVLNISLDGLLNRN